MDNNNRNKSGNNNDKKPKNFNTIIVILIAGVITFIGITMLNGMIKDATYKEISYSEFLSKVDNGEISEVKSNPQQQKIPMVLYILITRDM